MDTRLAQRMQRSGLVTNDMDFDARAIDFDDYAIGESVWLGWAGPPPAASAPPFAAAGAPGVLIGLTGQ
ncbi:MAG: hypothetical protein P8181_02595 [bacterium]